MRCWHLHPARIAYGASAKCGSTMLAALVAPDEKPPVRVGWIDVPEAYETVTIVRHPVDRFASLYANIQQRKRSRQNFYAQLEGLSPWDCFDKLLALSPRLDYDFHFQPQSLCLGPRLDTVVRLEAFGRYWAERFPDAAPPRHLNESQTVDIDDRTASRVANRYRADLALWEGAWHAT